MYQPPAAPGRLRPPLVESIEERFIEESIEDALVVSAKKMQNKKQKSTRGAYLP